MQYYYAPINIMPQGLTGDLTFSKNECPPIGAIFSSQNTSVKTTKLFSFSAFRRFSDLYQVAQRFMKIKSPTPRARSRSQQSPVFPHLCSYRGQWGIILTGALWPIHMLHLCPISLPFKEAHHEFSPQRP